jgi:hypothetical protein
MFLQVFALYPMLISQKQLKKVMVETQSGRFLGYIVGFEVETDTGVIEKYWVKGKFALANLWDNNIVINKTQIINFDEEKMVVDDAVVKAKVSKVRKLSPVENLKGSESVITSENNQ